MKHVRSRHCWEWLDEVRDGATFNFVRAAAWLQAFLKSFANTYHTDCSSVLHPPVGLTFRTWTRCILIRIPMGHVEALDVEFRRPGVAAVWRIPQLGVVEPFDLELP